MIGGFATRDAYLRRRSREPRVEMISALNQMQTKGSLIQAITQQRPTLSNALGRVADVLINAPTEFMVRSIQEIAEAAAVSEPSVVRFCRHHGFSGVPEFRIALAMSLVADASASTRSFLEPNVVDKAFVNHSAKMAVAREALKLIKNHNTLILDSGSTIELFAQQLRTTSGRTILTTGLNIVEALWGCNQHTVILPGGRLRFEARALTGRMVERSLENMRFDAVYFGADSVDPCQGLSTFNEEEAHQNGAMAKVSQHVIVLVDSTKFRAPDLHQFCRVEDIDTIVTDDKVPEDVVTALRSRGVKVLIADSTGEGARG